MPQQGLLNPRPVKYLIPAYLPACLHVPGARLELLPALFLLGALACPVPALWSSCLPRSCLGLLPAPFLLACPRSCLELLPAPFLPGALACPHFCPELLPAPLLITWGSCLRVPFLLVCVCMCVCVCM